ncbi:GNAT family N-acetyltransferase [Salinispirillum sp. LH 10-3-1]|uniref:GNAT family N-acetyltransferase n=1 Tax=Salinispirillum sp. LH 10-3-1 TaxID=2952525 RepID=A0AB38YJN9_9GAMM
MEIKEFTPEFAAALSEIYLESRRSAFIWLDASAFQLADFARDTDGERIWVCMRAGAVVGFISIWEPERFIHHLYVAPVHVRNGAGSMLLAFAKSQYAELSLKCLIHNVNAVRFYESKGFLKSATGTGVYGSYYLMSFKS